MSTEAAYYLREVLRARLGDVAFEHAERVAAEAPKPGPEAIELVRRVFAPAIRSLREKAAASGEPKAIGVHDERATVTVGRRSDDVRART